MILFILLCQIEWQAMNRPYSDVEQELLIHYTLPSDKLHVVTVNNEDRVEYEVQLTVFDGKKNQLHGDFWERRYPASQEEIEDSVRMIIDKKSERYELRIVDLHGGLLLLVQDKILPIKYLGNIIWDFHDDTISVTFTILNKDGDVDSIDAHIDDTRTGIYVRTGEYEDSLVFDVANMPNGSYKLKFDLYFRSVKIDGLTMPVMVSRTFYLDESSWAIKVDQLEYIASTSEIRTMKNAMVAERESLWRAFWKQNDPTPNTEYNEHEVEYFQRIDYCDEHFIHGDRGWRSDRAKIYVKYGPPDEIQAYPYHLGPPKSVSNPAPTLYDAYIVWIYYHNNREFVFGDKHGLGEYILLNAGGY
jgi:GWxTD domain-containing protein